MEVRRRKQALYVIGIIGGIVLLLYLQEVVNEQYLDPFDFRKTFFVSSLVMGCIGILLGAHNMYNRMVRDGQWHINYVILIFCFVLLIIGNGIFLQMPLILSKFYIEVVIGTPYVVLFAKIGFGYLLMFVVDKY